MHIRADHSLFYVYVSLLQTECFFSAFELTTQNYSNNSITMTDNDANAMLSRHAQTCMTHQAQQSLSAFEASRRISRAILTRKLSAWVWGPLSVTRLMGRVDMEQASVNVSFSSHQKRFNARAERMLQGRRRGSPVRLRVLCIILF